MDITWWSILKSDCLCSLQSKVEKLYTITTTSLGADCGSDLELLIAKFRLKLKNVGKTTRPFRHDLNQIPYDYTLEVTNRFKGLDLTECLKNYGWSFMTLYRRQWSRPSPRNGNAKRQNGCLRKPYKQLRKEKKLKAKEKIKDIPIWMQSFKEQWGKIRKPSSVINAKKQRKTIGWKRLEIFQEN